MPDRFFKNFLLICVFCHLALVTLSAFYINIADFGIIDFYQKASGASSSYGFFATGVGAKTRGVFDLVDKNGQKVENISLVSEKDRELEIRVGGVFDEFSCQYSENKENRQKLAASLVAAIFSKHQDAAYVTLRVQEFWPITMEEYRQGQRPGWTDKYVARFAKTPDVEGDAK